jgi:hypothetical protein
LLGTGRAIARAELDALGRATRMRSSKTAP